MHAVKNLTEQVVLIRLNSGIEINVAPKGILNNVAESEIRGNAILRKLQSLNMVEIGDSVAARKKTSVGVDQDRIQPSLDTDEPTSKRESVSKDRGDTNFKQKK